MALHGQQSGRLPALDGVRAVAILLVMVQHLVHEGPGWYGVDLFFALSGFLITTILLGERSEPHFWRMFYVRRVTRILPPFVCLLVLSTVFAHVDWRRLGLWIISSLSNVAMLRHQEAMNAAGFGVLWSLSVEEHFYLGWPVLVRRYSRAALVLFLSSVLVAEPVLRAIAQRRGRVMTSSTS